MAIVLVVAPAAAAGQTAGTPLSATCGGSVKSDIAGRSRAARSCLAAAAAAEVLRGRADADEAACLPSRRATACHRRAMARISSISRIRRRPPQQQQQHQNGNE